MILNHVQELLQSPRLPQLPPELAGSKDMRDIHDYLATVRQQLAGYAKGDFSKEITLRGSIAGQLKSLQANMRHLLWQIHQVAGGDFTQRVDFMGEFTETFNKMVVQLDDARTALKQKEEELAKLMQDLEEEVEKRGAALTALSKSEESFKYLAEHDPLTGLLNRRSFFAKAQLVLSRSAVMAEESSLILMDADYFKKLNDTYGHLQGDRALKHIADAASSMLRADDLIGRFGGEEFVLLFPHTNAEQGRLAAERIRKLVEMSPVQIEECSVPITVSIGVISIPPGKIDMPGINVLDFALGLADEALYKAKNNGRNNVVAAKFPDETPPPANP